MKPLNYHLCFICLFLLISSCGHRGIKNLSDKSSTKEGKTLAKRPSPQEAWEKAKQRLRNMVDQAKKLGPEAKEFLASNLFLKASQASLASDYQSSTLIYKHIMELSPEDPYVPLKYALDLIRLGKISSALLALEEHYPKSGIYREKFGMLLGGIYVEHRKDSLAVNIYQEILNHNPGNIDACIFLTKLHLRHKKVKTAFNMIEKCEKDNPDRGALSYHKGKLHLSLNDLEGAKVSFQKSLSVEPTFYQSALAMGLILEDQGNVKGAIKVYESLLQHWSNNRVILSRLVHLLFSLERYDDVIDHVQRLVFLDPEDLNLKVRLGILHAERREYEKSKVILQEVHREVPESDKVIFYLAATHRELEEHEEAITLLSHVSKDSALYFESSIQIAEMLSVVAVSDRTKDVQLFNFISERSQGNHPLKLELQVIKGQYYEASERIEKGIEIIEQIASSPNFTNAQKYYLATLQDRVKNYDRSIGLIEEIIQNDAKNAHAWNFIGYSYLERETNMEKAYKYIKKAVSLSPQDGYIRDSLGWYFYKTGKLDLALRELKLAHKLVKDDVTITKHLALVYEALNRYDLAKDFYFKALGLVKGKSEKEDVLQSIKRLDDYNKKGRYPASRSLP